MGIRNRMDPYDVFHCVRDGDLMASVCQIYEQEYSDTPLCVYLHQTPTFR